MKERRKSIYESLPPIKLYLEDVRNIHEILKNYCATVIIETDRYELNDVADLKNIGVDSLNKLTIRGNSPSIFIHFEKDGSHIYIDGDSIPNRGILSKIQETLKPCQRRIARLFVGWRFYAAALVTALFAPILIGIFTSGWLTTFLIASELVLLLSLFAYAMLIESHKYSTIILTERRADKSFIVRNKDRILVGIITAIVTAILTFAALKLV